MTIAGTILWVIAILPGVLQVVVLVIYFRRCEGRKETLEQLIGARSSGPIRMSSTRAQMDEWRSELELDRRAYYYPTLLTAVLSAAGGVVLVAMADPTDLLGLKGLKAFLSVPSRVAAGFAGAYVWGLLDFVDRFRVLNLSPAALHMLWFRLLLGPVLGHYLGFVLNQGLFNDFVAFAVGAIPIPDMSMWVREKAAATLSLTPQQAAPPRWHLVDGMTADMIRRMDEAGVTSVVHLGNQDPMNLLQRTNVEWRNILDMMDQAYLAGYTGENITKLRPRGIRGSIEMAILHVRLSSADAAIRAEAEALVTPLAADLGTDAASVRNLARNLYEDPQVDLIWTLWYERDDESFEPGDSTSEPVRADGPGADRQAATGK